MFRELLKLSLTLALVCAIAAASLAFTNAVTQPIIARSAELELNKTLGRLLPEAERFERVVLEDASYFLAWGTSDLLGAVMVAEGTGYGGPLEVLVALNTEGQVQGVEVREHKETIGIGTRVMQQSFLGEFIGKTPEDNINKDVAVVQGATVSSRAVTAAISRAMEVFEAHHLGEQDDEHFNLSKVHDGVFHGAAHGFKDDILVDVTVKDGRITKVNIRYLNDTPEVATEAAKLIPQRIVEAQHWKVDAVAGATITSEAIMQAVKLAFPDTSIRLDAIADGIYEGEADGFNGPIKVSVEVSGGKVTKIQVLSHKDTPEVALDAFNSVRQAIYTTQKLDVDMVSGATFSSEGLLSAITNALEKAPRK